MFMQKIRRMTKKHRKVLTVVVILLMIGLVGSFAVWNSDSYGVAGTSGEPLTYAQQVEQYETYIADNEPDSIEDADFSQANSMGSLYLELYTLCANAFNETYSSGAEDAAEQAALYNARAGEAVALSAQYYQRAIDLKPDSLNAVGEANLYAILSSTQLYSGNKEAAKSAIDTALSLAPESYQVVQANAEYIYNDQGFAAVETYLNDYLADKDQNSEEYTNIANVLAYYQYQNAYYEALMEQLSAAAEEDEANPEEAPEDEAPAAE